MHYCHKGAISSPIYPVYSGQARRTFFLLASKNRSTCFLRGTIYTITRVGSFLTQKLLDFRVPGPSGRLYMVTIRLRAFLKQQFHDFYVTALSGTR